jgi:hypothetical protein
MVGRARTLDLGVAVASQHGATWQVDTHIGFIHSVVRRRGTRMACSRRTGAAARGGYLPAIRIELGGGFDSAAARAGLGLAPGSGCRWWHMPCLHVANALDLVIAAGGASSRHPNQPNIWKSSRCCAELRRWVQVQRPNSTRAENAGDCASQVFGSDYTDAKSSENQ